ncbi:hypothetical protein V5O48_012997 [Marasmius crinis-equi]|uniref:Isomerase YbhE n=1 Tax=Marasmius crinis-equi TaxID=585013 RepID=A0ABR3F1L9_9AGAR
MVNFTILAGGFAVPGFIATYNFDSEASTLSLLDQSATGNSPSWIAQHPQNRSVLYAVNEVSPVGDLQSLVINTNGSVSVVETISTEGNGPTFTGPLSTGEITGLNFGSPNASFAAIDPADPTHFTGSQVLSFPVPEGAKSNPHMSLEFNGEVFIPDLGGDKIWRVVKDENGNFTVHGQIDQDAGSGPRHIAIQDDILFTLHETTSTLTAQRISAAPDFNTTLPLIANVSIVPPNQLNGTKFAGAELLISQVSEKFPNPLIYVSNRNIGETIDPNGDTIAIFEFTNGTAAASTNGTVAATKRMHRRSKWARQTDAGAEADGALTLLAQIPTGLQQIRSMALGRVDDGGDEFIIAGANTAGGVAVFQRVDGGRNLTLVAKNEEIANRTSFVFI